MRDRISELLLSVSQFYGDSLKAAECCNQQDLSLWWHFHTTLQMTACCDNIICWNVHTISCSRPVFSVQKPHGTATFTLQLSLTLKQTHTYIHTHMHTCSMYVTDSLRRQPSMTVGLQSQPPPSPSPSPLPLPPPPPPPPSPNAQKNTLWRCQIRPGTTKTGYKPCISRCCVRKKCGFKYQHQIIPVDLIKTLTNRTLEYTASSPPPPPLAKKKKDEG
jgi:hypothetical protein